jgi:hypothetical protein
LRSSNRAVDPATGKMVASMVNPVVLGRRFCSGCGRWRHVCDFGWQGNRYRSRCAGCHRRTAREAGRNRTPEQRERRREYDRFYTDAKRRRSAKPVRNFHNRQPRAVDRADRVFLELAPLVALLREYEAVHLRDNPFGANGSFKQLAAKSGVSERTINRYLTGESRHVALNQADRITHALGIPLAALYPPT